MIPDRPRFLASRSFAATVVAVTASSVVACGGDSTAPDGPGSDPDPRSYAVGWAPNAPRPESDLVLQVIDSAAAVSEATILQQPVPWPELLAGGDMEELIEERIELVTYLRSRGFDEVVFLVDPLDGLDRTREDPRLLEAGRSILEPEIRSLHEEWVRTVAERLRPDWLGLASEINTLGTLGEPELYEAIVDLVNDLAPEVRTLSPGTRVFVSFQADEALGHLPGVPAGGELETIERFDVDALGLSSYPGFVFETPDEMPDDYFGPIRDATDLPLIFVEGGWSSRETPSTHGTPAEQTAFFRRYAGFLDAVDARLWVMLTFADLDVPALDLPPDRAASLSDFAYMGIVDAELRRKPAYRAWEEIVERPLAR